MGYESKIYIVRKYEEMNWNEVIATFDLSKMGWNIYNGKSFRQLFKLTLDGDLYGDDGNTLITEDCYGDELEGAKITDVLDWIKQFNRDENYWRAQVFETLLEALAKHDNEILCYHYGY